MNEKPAIRLKRGQPHAELVTLQTDRSDPLRVPQGDPVFRMALDITLGRNVLAFGPSGAGKSVRTEALGNSSNYPTLLAGTALEKIEVEIVPYEIDLTPVLANMELLYEQSIDNGTTQRTPVGIVACILEHGLPSREEFLAVEATNRHAVESGEGKLRRYVLKIDDFDRVQNRMVTNSFMKFIENKRHHLWTGDVRFLSVQCMASSNNTCGRSGGKYVASQGIDLAIYNRFQAYHIDQNDLCAHVLRAEFPDSKLAEFIDRLTAFADAIRHQIAEGAFPSIGLISLRQLRPIVEDVVRAGMEEKEAARKLISAVGVDKEDATKAGLLFEQFFGDGNRVNGFLF